MIRSRPVRAHRFALDSGRFWHVDVAAGSFLSVALSRIPATLQLALGTMLFALPIAIVMGTISAIKPRSPLDRCRLSGFVSRGDLGGRVLARADVDPDRGGPVWTGADLRLWRPAIHDPADPDARFPSNREGAQVSRSTMLDEVGKPYVTTARAKGLRERAAIFGHALKNAAIPIITFCGDETSSLLNGAIVIETVFGWPGIGGLLIQSILRRDLPLVEATVFVISLLVISMNFLVDMAYTKIDPRVRFGSA